MVSRTRIKPLPDGLSLEGQTVQVGDEDVEFLYDVTFTTGNRRISRQMIFDRALNLIRGAQNFVLLDFFLFNQYRGKDDTVSRKLCQEVTEALLERKRSRPEMHIIVITDPVNTVYGGPIPPHFQVLREAGIPVVPTDLRKLRDSNPVYSLFWRIFFQWSGSAKDGLLPHPFAVDAGGVGARSWLALLNFKANHRKLIVADAPVPAGGRQMVSLVMSANPHDASSAHDNVGILVRGVIWKDLLRGEQAVLLFSGERLNLFGCLPAYAGAASADKCRDDPLGKLTVQVVTEGKIRRSLLEAIQRAGHGDAIDMAMFYLSERSIAQALLDAAERSVSIRLLLDPNRDAFGYKRSGIPNRPVAAELQDRCKGKIAIRWRNTHGEQFHTKMVLVKQPGTMTLFAGSANLTRRNIGDFNLEIDVEVTGLADARIFRTATGYFDRLWKNRDYDFSVPYETCADAASRLKYWLYRVQEWSGASSF